MSQEFPSGPYRNFTPEDFEASLKTLTPSLERLSNKEPSAITRDELEGYIEGLGRVNALRKAHDLMVTIGKINILLFDLPTPDYESVKEMQEELRQKLARA